MVLLPLQHLERSILEFRPWNCSQTWSQQEISVWTNAENFLRRWNLTRPETVRTVRDTNILENRMHQSAIYKSGAWKRESGRYAVDKPKLFPLKNRFSWMSSSSSSSSSWPVATSITLNALRCSFTWSPFVSTWPRQYTSEMLYIQGILLPLQPWKNRKHKEVQTEFCGYWRAAIITHKSQSCKALQPSGF